MKKILVILVCFFCFACEKEEYVFENDVTEDAIVNIDPIIDVPKESVEDSISQDSDMPIDFFDVKITTPEGALTSISSFQAQVHSFSKGGMFGDNYEDHSNGSFQLSYIFLDDYVFNRIDYPALFFPDKRGRFIVSNGKKMITYFSDSMEIEETLDFESMEVVSPDFIKKMIPLCTGRVEQSVIDELCNYVGAENVVKNDSTLTITATKLAGDELVPDSLKQAKLNIKQYIITYKDLVYEGSELSLSNAEGINFLIKEIPVYEEKTGLKVKVGKMISMEIDFMESLDFNQTVEGVNLSEIKNHLPDISQKLVFVEYYKDIKLNLINPQYFRPTDFGVEVIK